MESNQHRQTIDPIAKLSQELNAVMAMNMDACQEADALLKELAIYEERLVYVDAALAESQRIAGDITSDAEQRVGKIVYNAQKVIMPHQEVIAALNLEISQLTEKLADHEVSKQEILSQPVAEEKLADDPDEIMEQPTAQVAEQVEMELEMDVVPDKPVVKRQYSLREPQEFEEGQTEVGSAPEPKPYVNVESKSEIRWQYSMSNYQFSMSRTHVQVEQSVPDMPAAPPHTKRQYSMREPQGLDAEVETEAVAAENTEIPSVEYEPVVRRQYSMIRPQSLAFPELVQEMQAVENEENIEIVNEIAEMVQAEIIEVEDELTASTPEPESIPPVVLNENHFNLDVTLTLRYFDIDDQMRRNLINPTWQVKVVVEVPRENETASYGKTFTAVTSTLYRYDDVILNDVYPFDLISPGTQNIGMYFYNCVADSLAFMDLALKEISLWDKDEMVITINQRNKEFDQILLKGEDLLEDIRSIMLKKQNSLVKDPSRGLLGSLFKN